MKCTHYDFDTTSNHQNSKYIFQYVTDRQLTNIYHSHGFFEMCILLSGTVTEYFNGKTRVLQEGTATIIKPHEAHCFLDQSDGMRLVSLSIEKAEALRLLEAFSVTLPQREILFSIGSATSKVTAVIDRTASEHHCKLLFCQILSLFLDNQSRSIPYVLQKAVQQMHMYDNMQLGIPRLVALSGYSRSHLTRLVQQYYTCSLQALLTRLRMDAAYKEIILSTDPLEDIACKVGYASFSHFHKTFKAHFGVTPAALRKTHALWTI